jgi:hypothetical protein
VCVSAPTWCIKRYNSTRTTKLWNELSSGDTEKMTDNIANQNGGVKPQDTNASGPYSTGTGTGTGAPNSGPGKSKTGPPKRRPPKKGPRPNTNEGDSQPQKRPPKKNPNDKPDSSGISSTSTGNENTNSEVGNAGADGSKKPRNNNNKKRRKNNKKNPTAEAGDANATEVAGEKTQEPQKDQPESVPPVVDGEDGAPIATQLAEAPTDEAPRGKEGKLSRKQRRKLKTSQGGSVSGTGTIDSELTAAESQPESGVFLAAENETTTHGPGEKEQLMIEMLDGEPRGKDGTLSRKQRRSMRETMVKEEAESSENAPTVTETTTTEAANDAKQEPTDNSSKLPLTLPVIVQLDTSTDNQGCLPVHVQLDTSTAPADDSKQVGGDPLPPRKRKEEKAILETLEASLSAPESSSEGELL